MCAWVRARAWLCACVYMWCVCARAWRLFFPRAISITQPTQTSATLSPRHPPQDENQKVKTITALSLAALAEASSPYGIESFDDVLEPLWRGIRSLRGKVRLACAWCGRWGVAGDWS